MAQIELTTISGDLFNVRVEDIKDYYENGSYTTAVFGDGFYHFEVREDPDYITWLIEQAEKEEKESNAGKS